ncbi:hypothetical protein AMTRI_Chr10g8400 [Amborella trichopoda]
MKYWLQQLGTILHILQFSFLMSCNHGDCVVQYVMHARYFMKCIKEKQFCWHGLINAIRVQKGNCIMHSQTTLLVVSHISFILFTILFYYAL